MFTITTDTSIDVFRKEILADGCRYIPLTYRIKGKEYADEFSSDAEFEKFYRKMESTGELPTTSQITPFSHQTFFEKVYAKNKCDIVHLSLSGGLSTTYVSACTGAADFMSKNPGAKVHVVDTLGATTASVPVYRKAIELMRKGVEASIAADKLRQYAKSIRVHIVVDDLKYLRHGGRISAAAAAIGTALDIKPIIVFDDRGKLEVYKRPLGLKKALRLVINDIKETIRLDQKKVWIAHADARPLAEKAAEALRTELGAETEICWIGPVIGSHTGPGTIGFVFESDSGRKF